MLTSFIHSMVSVITTSLLINFVAAFYCGVMGLIFSFVYWDKLNSDRKCKEWSSVSGKITTSHVEEKMVFSRIHAGHTIRYVPVIRYSYDVAGIRYKAECIGNGEYVGRTPNSVDRWVRLFPLKAAVPVFYNPGDPSDAVLIQKSSSNIIGFIEATALSALSFILFALWVYRLLKG